MQPQKLNHNVLSGPRLGESGSVRSSLLHRTPHKKKDTFDDEREPGGAACDISLFLMSALEGREADMESQRRRVRESKVVCW